MREPTRPLSWQHLIQQSDLNQIHEHCEKLIQLSNWVQFCVSEPLKNQIKVVGYSQSVLKLEVVSSSVFMKFKYEKLQLMSLLRQKYLPELTSILCKVNPTLAKINVEKLKQWQSLKQTKNDLGVISKNTSNLLISLSTEIESESLKKALLNLAKLRKE